MRIQFGTILTLPKATGDILHQSLKDKYRAPQDYAFYDISSPTHDSPHGLGLDTYTMVAAPDYRLVAGIYDAIDTLGTNDPNRKLLYKALGKLRDQEIKLDKNDG